MGTRSVPDFHQFQFNETLSPNPRVGRGNILRQYEIIHLSRRPKPETFELMKLIEKYADRQAAVRVLPLNHPAVRLNAKGQGAASLLVANTGRRPLKLSAAVETGSMLQAKLADSAPFSLEPNAGRTLTLKLAAKGTD